VSGNGCLESICCRRRDADGAERITDVTQFAPSVLRTSPPKGESLSLPLAKHPRGDREKARRCLELAEGMGTERENNLKLRQVRNIR